ncbi:AzlC family ABC transporter permease [Arenibaculum pallidiluteum]|uniref:AzlC family ABC transporter permease n=1 Tax=Arenibaculum pallidiluteum TaxID=2812559 RepID=UPI001A97499F|nr:AzlC family ABC transporter permease [Arenibaculum pallidiluteum]
MTTEPATTVLAGTAFRRGLREAMGFHWIALFASYLGFGSLIRGAGMDLWLGLYSTLFTWTLPGQVVAVELMGIGASLAVIAASVALTNARLLPMVVVLMPLMRNPAVPRWAFYPLAHLVAVTGWAAALLRFPAMPVEERIPWLMGFGAVLKAAGLLGTAAGFALAGTLPPVVTLGLVFVNPVYFMLVFAADLRERAKVWALGLGAVLGPLLHLADAEWGLLAAGVVAGTAAFLIVGNGTARSGARRG